MGLSKKTDWKHYWRRKVYQSDLFIKRLFETTGLSERRFRRILNCVRLYDKEDAKEKKLSLKVAMSMMNMLRCVYEITFY